MCFDTLVLILVPFIFIRRTFTCCVFQIIQTGQLNEYTERKEMSSDVICMGLGRVPSGEQRCRFLAVGLSDNTVRIISLDPTVSSDLVHNMFVLLKALHLWCHYSSNNNMMTNITSDPSDAIVRNL